MANKALQYHSLSGDEIRTIILQRTRQGIDQALDLRVLRSYPLVRYKVTIELIPYQPMGEGHPPAADQGQRAVIEGREFVEYLPDAVELVHDSGIIGEEKDPQIERQESGLGRMETKPIEGRFTDVHVGAKVKIEEPEKPPLGGRRPIAPPLREPKADVAAGITAGKAEPLPEVELPGITKEEALRIQRQEAETWAAPAPDSRFSEALSQEKPIPGRVTIIEK